MVHRVAVYYTPAADDPLVEAASSWLGRDAFGRSVDPQYDHAAAVDAPRRYGFHATIKAPFRLAPGSVLGDIDRALAEFCAAEVPVGIGPLQIVRLGSFMALVEATPEPALQLLAARVVESFDRHRAPCSETELADRRAAGLTAAEEASLVGWGYPFTHDAFRFHMSLTGSLPEADLDAVEPELRRRFASLVGHPMTIDGLALFVEPTAAADFKVHARYPLGGGH
jgi:hypothetical protein